MRMKGMREVTTRRDLVDRALPGTRAALITLLARAELEAIRLQRERSIWMSNQRDTDRRLERAVARVESLRRALDGAPPRRRGARRLPRRSLPTQRRTVALEY